MNIIIFRLRYLLVLSCSVCFSPLTFGATVSPDELDQVAGNVAGAIEHCDEVIDEEQGFQAIFDCGDELFETRFNALDGVGMDVGDGGRFTRVPRADLANWSSTNPPRATGPNAEACNICHVAESIGNAGDGAGPAGLNVIRDPQNSAFPGSFIQRNTPHLFGMAGPQLLAEEMNADLEDIVRNTKVLACITNRTRTASLTTKGVNFGSVTVVPKFFLCLQRADVFINAQGVTDDLIVRPFQWKGVVATVRDFSVDAFHNELGMDAVELSGDDVDGDFDGIPNEISIDDATAMAIYLAAQPRPSSLVELNALRNRLINDFGEEGEEEADELGLPALSAADLAQIARGEQTFGAIGCSDCHRPSLKVNNVTFKEPSSNPNYRQTTFRGGQNAAASGVDPANPFTFNITADQPDNMIEVDGVEVAHLGPFETDAAGRAIVRLYGDLKLHDMGPRLAENIDETGSGASVWMTKELWGLANTAPYLHDGRATTIEEAIIEHGGEAENSRQNFSGLNDGDQDDVLAFLNNLVLFFAGEEEE